MRRGSFLRMMANRKISAVPLLLLATAFLAQGVAPAADNAPRPQFVPGSAFASAVKQQATGIYVLGTTRIRTWSAVHYVLMRDGRGLQIQTKAGGAWLPKLDGSGGGHTVGRERFDKLLALAGGVNRDVKQLPTMHRDRFLCVAGFGGCVTPMKPEKQAAMRLTAVLPGALLTIAPVPPFGGQQPYFSHGEPGQEFRFLFDASARRLWFNGWGIHAGWLVPPLDEI